jgi:hypothetical protein
MIGRRGVTAYFARGDVKYVERTSRGRVLWSIAPVAACAAAVDD